MSINKVLNPNDNQVVKPLNLFKYNIEDDKLFFAQPNIVMCYRNSKSLFNFMFKDVNSDELKIKFNDFISSHKDIIDFNVVCDSLVKDYDIKEYHIYEKDDLLALDNSFRIMSFKYNNEDFALISLEKLFKNSNNETKVEKILESFIFQFDDNKNDVMLYYLLNNITLVCELHKHHWHSSDRGKTFICIETGEKLSDYNLKIHKSGRAKCPICKTDLSQILSYSEEIKLMR